VGESAGVAARCLMKQFLSGRGQKIPKGARQSLKRAREGLRMPRGCFWRGGLDRGVRF
jgi:hypothetical protein